MAYKSYIIYRTPYNATLYLVLFLISAIIASIIYVPVVLEYVKNKILKYGLLIAPVIGIALFVTGIVLGKKIMNESKINQDTTLSPEEKQELLKERKSDIGERNALLIIGSIFVAPLVLFIIGGIFFIVGQIGYI